jgi:hypothetical protein
MKISHFVLLTQISRAEESEQYKVKQQLSAFAFTNNQAPR